MDRETQAPAGRRPAMSHPSRTGVHSGSYTPGSRSPRGESRAATPRAGILAPTFSGSARASRQGGPRASPPFTSTRFYKRYRRSGFRSPGLMSGRTRVFCGRRSTICSGRLMSRVRFSVSLSRKSSVFSHAKSRGTDLSIIRGFASKGRRGRSSRSSTSSAGR